MTAYAWHLHACCCSHHGRDRALCIDCIEHDLYLGWTLSYPGCAAGCRALQPKAACICSPLPTLGLRSASPRSVSSASCPQGSPAPPPANTPRHGSYRPLRQSPSCPSPPTPPAILPESPKEPPQPPAQLPAQLPAAGPTTRLHRPRAALHTQDTQTTHPLEIPRGGRGQAQPGQRCGAVRRA